MNSNGSRNRTSRWRLFFIWLPPFVLMVTMMSIEASILAKFQPRDLSSMFKVTFSTKNVIPTTVFKPAFERAGYNLSDSLNSTRFSTHLSNYYVFEHNNYSRCLSRYERTDNCETPQVMEGSVFADFPRQFLFNATHEILDKMTNTTIRIQSPEDIVPLLPKGYLEEMFKDIRAPYMNPYVFGIVVSTIGVAVVTICIAICIIKSTMIKCCIIIVGVVFVIQIVKVPVMATISNVEPGYGFSTSKVQQFFSSNYPTWGLSLSRCSALYKAEPKDFPLMIVNLPLSVFGVLSAVVILDLSPSSAKSGKSKKEEQQDEEERKDRLV